MVAAQIELSIFLWWSLIHFEIVFFASGCFKFSELRLGPGGPVYCDLRVDLEVWECFQAGCARVLFS